MSVFVVVTYKKVRPNNTETAQGRSVCVEDTEKEVDLDSGQFGITDPEDEGKAWLQFWWCNLFGSLLDPSPTLPSRTHNLLGEH